MMGKLNKGSIGNKASQQGQINWKREWKTSTERKHRQKRKWMGRESKEEKEKNKLRRKTSNCFGKNRHFLKREKYKLSATQNVLWMLRTALIVRRWDIFSVSTVAL